MPDLTITVCPTSWAPTSRATSMPRLTSDSSPGVSPRAVSGPTPGRCPSMNSEAGSTFAPYASNFSISFRKMVCAFFVGNSASHALTSSLKRHRNSESGLICPAITSPS